MANQNTAADEEFSPEQIARLIKNEQRRKEYRKAYRAQPGVKEAYQARSKARRARTQAIVKWALAQDNLPKNLKPVSDES